MRHKWVFFKDRDSELPRWQWRQIIKGLWYSIFIHEDEEYTMNCAVLEDYWEAWRPHNLKGHYYNKAFKISINSLGQIIIIKKRMIKPQRQKTNCWSETVLLDVTLQNATKSHLENMTFSPWVRAHTLIFLSKNNTVDYSTIQFQNLRGWHNIYLFSNPWRWEITSFSQLEWHI